MIATKIPLILGSQSPRRKSLLTDAGIRFQVFTPKIQEKSAPLKATLKGAPKIVSEISQRKAHDITDLLPPKWSKECLLLTADTLVFFRGRVLGKPRSAHEALSTLKALSGKTHFVYTGVTLVRIKKREIVRTYNLAVQTKVRFFRHTTERLAEYVLTGEPMDKAGSYGAQGLGSFLVEEYHGSYSNVVGLPVSHTLRLLEKASADFGKGN